MSHPISSTTLPGASEPSADPEPPDLCLSVVEEDGDWSAIGSPEDAIRTASSALAAHEAGRGALGHEATVVLGSDVLLQGLNRTYRGKDAPTNVLSFPFEPRAAADMADGDYLGDVVLAAETVLREAAERGIDPAHHMQHLVIHGLLHLLGYDHETDAEAARMERAETEILAGLGIADPYADAAAGR